MTQNKLFNRVKFATSTTGTSDAAVGSAESGFLTPAIAGISNGEKVDYWIEDGSSFAHGRGTYSTTGPTLTRDSAEMRWNGSTYASGKLSLSGSATIFFAPTADSLQVTDNVRFPLDGNQLTIASGAITITGSHHRVTTESSASTDDLDTINGASGDGQILILQAYADTLTVVCKDGTGNLVLAGDFSLDNRQDRIVLMWDSAFSNWVELSRSDNGA